MTDKTPKKTAETPVNTQATLADTTDTARDSEPKSRALPQADALKARFKAGSNPMQLKGLWLIKTALPSRRLLASLRVMPAD
ncbi:Uncharacterised protein [Serratia entomophila]|nr:Uncharacterised protein [Serratia entomophila]